jgi:hypothetical protein
VNTKAGNDGYTPKEQSKKIIYITCVSALYRLQPKRTHQFIGRYKKQRFVRFILVFTM